MDHKDEMRRLIEIMNPQSFNAPLEQTLGDMKMMVNAVKDISDRIDIRVRKSLQPTNERIKKAVKRSNTIKKVKPFPSVQPPK